MTMETHLEGAIAQRGALAWLIIVGETGPHTGNVMVGVQDGRLRCVPGKSANANIARQPGVSLFWPADEPAGCGLIVNGTVQDGLDGNHVTIFPTKAVWQRPGEQLDPAVACTSDCVPVTLPLRAG